MIESGAIAQCLPDEYLSLLEAVPLSDIMVSLQTRHSNRFLKIIRKIKKKVEKSSKTDLYKEFKAVFLTDEENDLLAISLPFLFDTSKENSVLPDVDWNTAYYQPRGDDLVALPFLNVRRKGYIGLFEQSTGVLCPATYGGMVLNLPKDNDHICVCTRDDDPHIGEKVLRGILAINALIPDFHRKCVQLITSRNAQQCEISSVFKDDLKQSDMALEDLIATTKQHWSSGQLTILEPNDIKGQIQ